MLSRRSFLLGMAAATTMTACGSSAREAAGAGPSRPAASRQPVTLRLGLFPNITHAPALVGVERGLFATALGANRLETATFNAGPEAVEALFSDSIDATFIGPNPAINAFVKSNGDALRIVAGCTSGGAFLVVAPQITAATDLRGATMVSPQLGGTQDVALRWWLKAQGYTTDTSGGGDVHVVPQDNAATLDAFRNGDIEGAWLPEPWASRLVQDGGAKVLVDERSLWPGGRYVTTHLVVARSFLAAHGDVVEQLLTGLLDSLDSIAAQPAQAQQATNARIGAITDKPLKGSLIAAAWPNLSFTADPLAASLRRSADAATALGLLGTVDLHGIYDLSILNQLRGARGLTDVKGL